MRLLTVQERLAARATMRRADSEQPDCLEEISPSAAAALKRLLANTLWHCALEKERLQKRLRMNCWFSRAKIDSSIKVIVIIHGSSSATTTTNRGFVGPCHREAAISTTFVEGIELLPKLVVLCQIVIGDRTTGT